MMKKIFIIQMVILGLFSACRKEDVPNPDGNQLELSVGGNSFTTASLLEIGPDNSLVSSTWTSFNKKNPIQEYGFVWATHPDPRPDKDSFIIWREDPATTIGKGSFSHRIENLKPFTYYWVRGFAKAKNSPTEMLGALAPFRTTGFPPRVKTGEPESIESDYAIVKGTILGIGSSPVQEYGHIYSTEENPTLKNPRTIFNGPLSDSLEFTSVLDTLQDGKVYYYRAYAINEDSLAYGAVLNFVTLALPRLYIDSVWIVSESLKPDGKANKGEDVTFRFSIKNSGYKGATGTKIEVYTESNYVNSISPAIKNLGTIPGNSSVEKTADFQVSIDPFADWDSLVVLNVVMSDNEGKTWNETFEFIIESTFLVKEGLVAYYTFDRDDTTTNKINSEINNDKYLGLRQNSPGYASDKPGAAGYSLQFYSQNKSFINIGKDPLRDLEQTTINFWIKCTGANYNILGQKSTTNSQTGWADVARIFIDPNGIFLTNSQNFAFPTNSFFDGDWHMITVSIKNGEQRLYYDGILADSRSFSRNVITLVPGDNGFSIGARLFSDNTNFEQPFNGKLDNIRIYDRVLNSSQILQLYQAIQ